MEKLNYILRSHVADGHDTKDKLLGAAFVVVNKDGEFPASLSFAELNLLLTNI
jgi:hypothetical protein